MIVRFAVARPSLQLRPTRPPSLPMRPTAHAAACLPRRLSLPQGSRAQSSTESQRLLVCVFSRASCLHRMWRRGTAWLRQRSTSAATGASCSFVCVVSFLACALMFGFNRCAPTSLHTLLPRCRCVLPATPIAVRALTAACEADRLLAAAIHASMFGIRSSLRADWPYSVSPGDLARGGCTPATSAPGLGSPHCGSPPATPALAVARKHFARGRWTLGARRLVVSDNMRCVS